GQRELRKKLRRVLVAGDYAAEAQRVGAADEGGLSAVFWKLRLGKAWSVPVVELTRGKPRATAILLNDAGRRADPVNAQRLLDAGYRVLAVDLFYFGEARVQEKDLDRKSTRLNS